MWVVSDCFADSYNGRVFRVPTWCLTPDNSNPRPHSLAKSRLESNDSNSLLLSNAMLLSSWTDKMIELDYFEDELFFSMLQDKIANSKVNKDPNKDKMLDNKKLNK